MSEMTLGGLLNVSVRHVANKIRASRLKRVLENSKLDIELSESRIADANATIKEEQENIKSWQELQPKILSELRDLGAI